MNDYPDDIFDFLFYYTYQDSNNEYVVPLNRVQEAIEYYYLGFEQGEHKEVTT